MFIHDPYYSAHPNHANQTIEEPDNHPIEKLEKAGWASEVVKYHYNQYGFRCNDFKPDNNICFLGCSITLGTGLNIEDTFSDIVAKQLQMNNCNLAKSGGSMDTIFRIAYHWLPQLKPKITVIVATDNSRSEYFDYKYKTHEPLLVSDIKRNSWYIDYLRNENNYKINFEKNKYALHQLCKEINTALVWFEHGQDFGFKVDVAKDLMHPGKQSNRVMAEMVLQAIEDKNIKVDAYV